MSGTQMTYSLTLNGQWGNEKYLVGQHIFPFSLPSSFCYVLAPRFHIKHEGNKDRMQQG